MTTGWRYRVVAALGTLSLTALAVGVANLPVVQRGFTTYVPLFWRLDPVVLAADSLWQATLLSVLFVGVTMVPLYKPRPRRILDTVAIALRRVFVAGLGLATLGYFEWSHRLPRSTLVLVVGLTMVLLPAWFVWIRRRPSGTAERTLIVGDDLGQIERITPAIDGTLVGYLAPSVVEQVRADGAGPAAVSQKNSPAAQPTGHQIDDIERIGGLSSLEEAIAVYDVDAVVLAFSHPDRADFFGALEICHELGVTAQVHREYADSVLVAENEFSELVDVDIEPWDVQDRLLKRMFDIAFSGIGLLALSPVIVLITIAIKIEGNGPVLFTQKRTHLFGETFTIYKFRTLKPKPDEEVGTDFQDDRETPLGNLLRMTHLDEIPQLWSIFVGDMSVVGPRPAQTALEDEFQAAAKQWRQRWFVKPGLTGLAQINDATSKEPRRKIRYDIQYIRNQSFWYDLKIVFRQIWMVLVDVLDVID